MQSAGQVTAGDRAESRCRARKLRQSTRRPASGRRRRSANTHPSWGANRSSTRKHRQALIIVAGTLPDYGEPCAGVTFSSRCRAQLARGTVRVYCPATLPENALERSPSVQSRNATGPPLPDTIRPPRHPLLDQRVRLAVESSIPGPPRPGQPARHRCHW